jgi:hypothetical protein
MQDAFFVLALSFRGHDRPQIFVKEPVIVSTSSATNNTYIVRAPWGSLRIVRLLSEVDRTLLCPGKNYVSRPTWTHVLASAALFTHAGPVSCSAVSKI